MHMSCPSVNSSGLLLKLRRASSHRVCNLDHPKKRGARDVRKITPRPSPIARSRPRAACGRRGLRRASDGAAPSLKAALMSRLSARLSWAAVLIASAALLLWTAQQKRLSLRGGPLLALGPPPPPETAAFSAAGAAWAADDPLAGAAGGPRAPALTIITMAYRRLNNLAPLLDHYLSSPALGPDLVDRVIIVLNAVNTTLPPAANAALAAAGPRALLLRPPVNSVRARALLGSGGSPPGDFVYYKITASAASVQHGIFQPHPKLNKSAFLTLSAQQSVRGSSARAHGLRPLRGRRHAAGPARRGRGPAGAPRCLIIFFADRDLGHSAGWACMFRLSPAKAPT